MVVGDEPWPGEVVRGVLGLVLGHDEESEPLTALVGLALRRNPRRAHLPVSRVLGKHIPIGPARVRSAAEALAHRAAQCLDADPVAWSDPVVVGYAENATALAHLVADTLDADHVVNTTRRTVGDGDVLAAFDEEHSHAPRHVLVPDEPERWTPDRPLVLVDDELSTGRTVAVTLRLLHRLLPRRRYVVATLADLRGPDDDAIAVRRARPGCPGRRRRARPGHAHGADRHPGEGGPPAGDGTRHHRPPRGRDGGGSALRAPASG